jgi:hypothetical protein
MSSVNIAAARSAHVSGTVTVEIFGPNPNQRLTNSTIDVGTAETLYINGWAFPNRAAGDCTSIGLMIDNSVLVAGVYGGSRADVAAFYKAPNRVHVGYAFAIPASQFTSGNHSAYVVCFGAKSVGYRNAMTFNINVF